MDCDLHSDKSRSESPAGDHDEEENISTIAVGAASPILNPQSPIEPRSPRAYLQESPLEDNLDDEDGVQPIGPAPKQLALNKQNLASFEHSVKEGKVPLRADVIGGGNYAAMRTAAGITPAVNDHNTSLATAVPPHSEVDESIGDLQPHAAHRKHRYGSAVSQSSTAGNSQLHHSMDDKGSMFSIQTFVGSPRAPFGDMLNEENLKQHLLDLSSGMPVPLKSENIAALPGVMCTRTNNNNNTSMEIDHSIIVEPSEGDLGAALASEADMSASASASHRRRWVPPSDSCLEEWSTHTLPSHEEECSIPLPSLSKENLRKLRKQLDAGETPLRPEVLAGLGDAMRSINSAGLHGGKPSSMHVEQCNEDGTRSFPRTTRSSGVDLNDEGRASTVEKMESSPVGARDLHPGSFRSTFVEATVEAGASDGDNDESRSQDGAQRDESVFLTEDAMTNDQDDLTHVKRCILDVANSIKDLQVEQTQIKDSVAHILRSAAGASDLRIELRSLRQEVESLREQAAGARRQVHRDAGGLAAPSKIRLVIQMESPNNQRESESLRSFIVPVDSSSTVGACKAEFLRRLELTHHENRNTDEKLTMENTVLRLGEHALFDQDTLDKDLQLDPSHDGGYTLTLRRI